MMLYLTGATSSLKKSEDVAQTDPMKSLGGYISSSPVPNNAINSIFDLVSLKSIKDKQKETVCIALVNKLSVAVKNVTLKLVCGQDDVCSFKIAATLADDNLMLEHIPNRYAEPVMAEFYDATFYQASVDVKIVKPAISGESISFEPFDVVADVEEAGVEGTWKAINSAFSASETYQVKRLSETEFRVERKDDASLIEPLACSYIATDDAEFSFSGDFQNLANNDVLLTEEFAAEQAIGIWIQREIKSVESKSYEDFIKDYDEKREEETKETVELVINYDEIEEDTEQTQL